MTKPQPDETRRFIWATRGRTWGFRFLRDGGFDDPLTVYEQAFAVAEEGSEVWGRISDGVCVVRFPDPDGRTDAAGRLIPHEFVLIGAWTDHVDGLEEARQLLWDLVADEFRQAYELAEPPPQRS